MQPLADEIEKTWQEILLPGMSREYYRKHQQESDYKKKFIDDVIKELQFLGIVTTESEREANQYIHSQRERLLTEVDNHFAYFLIRKVELLWPQLIDGFDYMYISRCLTDSEGEEKFAGSVFEAIFDRIMFDDNVYEDIELKEIESYVLSKKDKWLLDAKAYHKL